MVPFNEIEKGTLSRKVDKGAPSSWIQSWARHVIGEWHLGQISPCWLGTFVHLSDCLALWGSPVPQMWFSKGYYIRVRASLSSGPTQRREGVAGWGWSNCYQLNFHPTLLKKKNFNRNQDSKHFWSQAVSISAILLFLLPRGCACRL